MLKLSINKSLIISANIILLSIFLNNLYAQNIENDIFSKIEGHWEGAFIKNNSYQKLEIQFFKSEQQITSLQIIEEWHPQFGEFVLPVKIDSLENISFNTGLGKAIVELDRNSLEMVGTIEGTLPSIYVHLKKVPTPPKANFKTQEIRIKNGGVTLFGHLHEPLVPSKTAIIIVGGRSCNAGNTKYDLYAKLLRAYGVSVLVFNKRGTGKSTGNCSLATISDLASDVIACQDYLASHQNSYEHVGVLGNSAGGWVMAKAEEKTDFDFMISIVGPSTSVYDQQIQSMEYGFDFYKLPQKSKENLLEYTNMMFKAKPTTSNYSRFKELLKFAERDGWLELLDETDIPQTLDGIEKLWVRRHNYDPKEVLSSYNKPFLAIYGEIDWIVPYEENINLLNKFFNSERKSLLTTVIAKDAEHGTETEGKYISLKNNKSYWRFFRISPQVQVSIIDFLKDNNFID